jgi:hypothetical protein
MNTTTANNNQTGFFPYGGARSGSIAGPSTGFGQTQFK